VADDLGRMREGEKSGEIGRSKGENLARECRKSDAGAKEEEEAATSS
jgi:hypothetical protein